VFFFFFPPVVQVLIGIAVVVGGVLKGSVILDVVGALLVARGGYRWLRKRRRGDEGDAR
jgi:Na+/H+-translocating membrane pyrophosphatase